MKKIVFTLIFSVFLFIGYCAYFVYDFVTPTKGEPIPLYQTSQQALLVIDIQKDLTNKNGKLPINPELTDKMIKNVNLVINDFAQKQKPVIYIRHFYKPNILIEQLTKGALTENTDGAKTDPRINIVSEHEVIKYKMDPFKNTDLDNLLQNHKISHVYLTGIDAKLCIDKTIKAACNRNLKVTVISDGIGANSMSTLNKKLSDYKNTCASIMTTNELINKQE